VDGLGVGICNKVCSSCLRKANLAFNKCCSAATPLSKKNDGFYYKSNSSKTNIGCRSIQKGITHPRLFVV
jgi:hypothetical protein